MQKYILILLLLACSLPSFAQQKADTTFLLRKNTNGVYHAIYIERDKTSVYYKYLSAFRFDETNMESYRSSVALLKEKDRKPFKKYSLTGVPRKWCPLFVYKNNYYLYSPSDYILDNRVAISDTTYINYQGEGPEASRINSFQKMDGKTWRFRLGDYDRHENVIIIHIIDAQKGIAVFEDPDAPQADRYRLMVSAEKMKRYPIIVNSCKTSKQLEYSFEQPDFERLLAEKR